MINEHVVDEAFGLGCYRRKIGNNLNYKDEQGQYVPTACNLIANIEQLDKQTHDIVGSSLKVSIGDDRQNLTYTIRSSDKPNLWVIFTALNTNPIDPIETNGTLTYKNVWEGIDVRLQPAAGKIKETIICNTKTPPKMVWSIKQSKQLIIKCNDNVAIWTDRDGKEIFKTLAPWGQDSSVLALSPNGKQQLKASMFLDDKGNFVLELDQKDLDDAILPCEYDPTTVEVSGTTAIDDTVLYSVAPGSNYGTWNNMFYHLNDGRSIVRIATASIPTGTLSACQCHFRNTGASPVTLTAWVIAAANDWTETGACWSYRKAINVPWAGGSTGCGTSGTDYDADASPPQHTTTDVYSNQAWALPAAWFTAWRDGTHVNNGFVEHSNSTSNQSSNSSESAPPLGLHFSIDWTEAAVAKSFIYFKMI